MCFAHKFVIFIYLQLLSMSLKYWCIVKTKCLCKDQCKHGYLIFVFFTLKINIFNCFSMKVLEITERKDDRYSKLMPNANKELVLLSVCLMVPIFVYIDNFLLVSLHSCTTYSNLQSDISVLALTYLYNCIKYCMLYIPLLSLLSKLKRRIVKIMHFETSEPKVFILALVN